MTHNQNRVTFGIVLISVATFLVLAPMCGLLGEVVARGLGRLIGQVGTVIFTFTLFALGITRIVPLHVWARVATRLFAAPKQPKRKAPIVEEPEEELPPAQRLRLDEVRGAFKNLGYRSGEYERIVAEMDPTQPLATLVRNGLRQLQRS